MIYLRRSALGVALVLTTFGAGWFATFGLRLGMQQWREHQAARLLSHIIGHQWQAMASTGSPLGSPDEPPILIEFSDYQCPFCRRANATVDSAVRSLRLGVVYHHFPLSTIHPAATGAARAAICAEQQGRFHEMHHLLMTTDGWQKDTNWVQVAVDAGVQEKGRFKDCLQAQSTTDRLEADRQLALELRVTGTPSFFTRVQLLRGTVSLSTLGRIAAAEAKSN